MLLAVGLCFKLHPFRQVWNGYDHVLGAALAKGRAFADYPDLSDFTSGECFRCVSNYWVVGFFREILYPTIADSVISALFFNLGFHFGPFCSIVTVYHASYFMFKKILCGLRITRNIYELSIINNFNCVITCLSILCL